VLPARIERVHDENLPIVQRHVLEPSERIDSRLDPPERPKIPHQLFLDRGADAQQLLHVNSWCERNEGKVDGSIAT
jgi:hypothetical protein